MFSQQVIQAPRQNFKPSKDVCVAVAMPIIPTPIANAVDSEGGAAWFRELEDAYLSTYSVARVYHAIDLQPCAEHVLPGLQASKVYDAARSKGVNVLGIAPANISKGKFTVPLPGGAARVYCGPSKLPHTKSTKFSSY